MNSTISNCNSLILECVLKHVRVQWQALYDNETKGMHYKAIAPVVGQKPLAQFPSRIKSVTINRLQFGPCLLHMSRFTVGQADDGLCSTCSVPETIHHFFASILFLIKCCAAHSLTY